MTDTSIDAERWARARFISRLIPEHIDLRDFGLIVLELLNARLRYRDFWDVIDEVIVMAFGNRMEDFQDIISGEEMKQIIKYAAFDGEMFDTEAECRTHERSQTHFRLVGLTVQQVEAAYRRDDVELADAIEFVGTKIAAARRADGDLRRVRNRISPIPGAPEETERLSHEKADLHEGQDKPLQDEEIGF